MSRGAVICIVAGLVFCSATWGAAPLPYSETFEAYPVGANPGWRTGFPPIGTGEGSVGVTDVEASPAGGGAKSLRWAEPAGGQRSGVSSLWDPPANSGTAVMKVAYDFKIVQHTTRGLSFVVSGWSGGSLVLNVYNVRFDADTGDGLPVGWNYYHNGAWNTFLPVSSATDVIGHWFHYDATIDVGARTVDLTIQRLDGGLSGHILGSFQGGNPLDADVANYHGINIFQANAGAASEVLLDNVNAYIVPEPASVLLLGFGAAGAVFRRCRRV